MNIRGSAALRYLLVLTGTPQCNATRCVLENEWTDACDTCDASSPPTLPHGNVSRANKTTEGEIFPEFCCRDSTQPVFIQAVQYASLLIRQLERPSDSWRAKVLDRFLYLCESYHFNERLAIFVVYS